MAIWLFFSSHGGHRDLHVLTHPFPPRRSSDLNFEARIHPNIKANFLASPPLVVAYALAGTVLRDLMTEPVGQGKNGDVWLGDIWPSNAAVQPLMSKAMAPAVFRSNYDQIKSDPGPMWEKIAGVQGENRKSE